MSDEKIMTDTAEFVPVATADWTYEQKQDVFQRLFRDIVGAQLLDPSTGFAALPFETGDILSPGFQTALMTAPHIAFRPERLVIIENVFEKSHFNTIKEYESKTVGPFWRRRTEQVVKEVREKIVMTRDLWSICGIFSGNQPQLINASSVNGSLFGHDGQVRLRGDVCLPGVFITIQVTNLASCAAKFRGVVLGTVVDELWRKAKPLSPDTV